ncbi:MAG: enoyl-CoA hydratase/isomerase family protein [Hyphomicrobiaceae bacterium]
MYQTLEVDRNDGVVTLWMNRPALHNAFNDVVVAELTAALRLLDADAAARIVVLAGRGKSFSAGADLAWMKRAAGSSQEDNLRDARALAQMLRTLAFLSKPTVARVHGAAIAGGMGLVSCCDIAVASTQASFAVSEVKLGLVPSAIGPYVIAAIGERQARRYFLSAERISAVRACVLGLVHEVAEPDELDAKVNEIVGALMTGGPKAQRAAKDLIRAVVHRPVTDALLEDTAQRIADIRTTPEAAEGIGAFLEKRPAEWGK